MDAKGAQELARRLDALHGERVDTRPERLKNPDAAPIFHWLGIEPPQVVEADDEAEDASPRRR
ncbi:MAG TPA: hypothetical protein VGH82_03090 [Gaiellaceae bacterium]